MTHLVLQAVVYRLTLSLICSQKQNFQKNLLGNFYSFLQRNFSFKNVFTLCTFLACSAMLEMGKKKPWPYALEKMTGSKEMSVAPMKEYFQPLQEWLVKERCSKKYKIGWPEQPADGVEVCRNSGLIVHSDTLWLIVTVISVIQSLASL